MNLYNSIKQGKSRNDNQDEGQAEVFSISYKPQPGGIFNFYLFGAIESPRQFIGAVEILRDASEDDEFIINLQTPGGSLPATDTFLQAIQYTKAHVHINATGDVCSAGTAIMLSGHSYSISENARFMIHNGSAGSGGKTSDYKAWALSDIEYMEKFMRRTYQHFLTESELQALIEGKDFWLTPEQFVERAERRSEILKEAAESQQAAAVEAAVALLKAQLGEPEENDEGEPEVVITPQKKPRLSRKKVVAQV